MSATISAAVKALSEYVDRLREGPIEEPGVVVFWCLGILATSPGTHYESWATRRPYRWRIHQPRKANQTAIGRRALIDYLKLTISDLESGYRQRVDVYNLPGAHVKTLSDEHKTNIAAGVKRTRREQEEARKKRLTSAGLPYAA